jgi:hypothetical protein
MTCKHFHKSVLVLGCAAHHKHYEISIQRKGAFVRRTSFPPKLGEVYLPIPSIHQSHPHTCPLLSPPSLCRCLLLHFTSSKTLALGADCRRRPPGPARNTLTASLRHRNGAAMSTDSYERIAAESRRRGTCFGKPKTRFFAGLFFHCVRGCSFGYFVRRF